MNNVIYRIRNVVNNKFYVGSTINTAGRFKAHRRRLRAGNHQSPHMQAAWNKYGEDCFKFEVLMHIEDVNELLSVEQVWLDEHAGKPYCYNWATDASAPMRGKTHTVETLGKIAQNRTPPKGVDHYGYGLTRSAETKAKISEKCKGLVNPMKGKTHSEQSKANMSAAVKRGEESHFYGKRPTNADDLQKEIYAVLPDRTTQTFVSLTHMRDTLGVSIAAIIRACKSGNPIKFGVLAGWVLSYVGKEINEAPEIPEEYMSFPRTRQDAKDKGEKQYYTGVPCERGHLSPRKTKGTCIACMKADYKKDNDRRKANKLIDTTLK
ncbi:grpIintron_endo, group I intron endonuclease [uncultured Caudovirales phage]|uniref:GrpIintron_endo, group I intron endonuclease n=1 Tax=uncultured Caudovirales phage TaxID=2100421 RepID=A0A6J5QIA0_9CAUD|nr:grpIintron_endo, group I intron endonuclease [uncultured Caudovirales phage]